ncbi:gamma-glutamylcyclotransferase [Blastomonas sp.]|uniref:gamma-glutamylcyclotransferase family protein n=1 Tax=Blastomonas sp. TaxID=1909299 RepID=UPI00261A7D55|nr:gamma-glutamylcyclotransferase family protein [Blastomonas sp.]MDM7956796.1 gamma-glutamylcyclotransferase family protein [Blastomonas sp.]
MPARQAPDLLFVYGTLRRGSDHPNAARLARESDWLGTASLTATLYRVSWHPALVLEGCDAVTGDLLRLHDAAASQPWLDAFEGCAADDPLPHDYRRETAKLVTQRGTATALVYVWNLAVDGLERIASGDWLAG